MFKKEGIYSWIDSLIGPFTWILHVKHTLKNFGKFEFFPKFIHNSPKMVGGVSQTASK